MSTSFMDVEFEPMKDLIHDFIVNCTGANENLTEIERMIRVIKERVRAVFCTMPFIRIPARILVELVKFTVMWLNEFPENNGVTSD